ncbi:Cro protein [Gordonia phage Squiddly]|nr:Cro protein [Gordonia phage Squiddly]
MGLPRVSQYGIWQELRVIRTKDGHSLSSLAKAAGISLAYLSDLENGHRWPNATQLKKLAMALNCPMSVLERHRNVDSEGGSVAFRQLVADVVAEELERRAS